MIAHSCTAAGLRVKVVDLPDLPHKGDVSDWLAAGHTKEELIAIVKATPIYPEIDESTAPAPAIDSVGGQKRLPAAFDQILDSVTTFVRRFVVVTDHQATAIALWAAHTHAIEAFDCTPYLQVTSASKRAGKTRLIEVLEPLVTRPWFTGRTSAAALMRKVDAECPTLLLDESDAALNGDKDYAEALRGQLNTGYRRSG